MENNNSNEPIVLGEIKKEKSSKPFFVFLIFALIIGVIFGLPYIKEYMSSNDNPVTEFFNKLLKEENSEQPITTTAKKTTTTTQPVEPAKNDEIVVTCTNSNNTYEYIFQDSFLTIINHTYTVSDKTDKSKYITDLANHRDLAYDISKIANSSANVTETDEGFVFTAKLDLNNFNSSSLKYNKDDNYYELSTDIDTLKNEMTDKGFDCK